MLRHTFSFPCHYFCPLCYLDPSAPGNIMLHSSDLFCETMLYIFILSFSLFSFSRPFFCVDILLSASMGCYGFPSCPSDKRGAVSDHQPGDGADWLASWGHQISPQWTIPGCAGKRQSAHVSTRSVNIPSNMMMMMELWKHVWGLCKCISDMSAISNNSSSYALTKFCLHTFLFLKLPIHVWRWRFFFVLILETILVYTIFFFVFPSIVRV